MEKAIKRYMPIFVLPTFCAFIIGFIVPFLEGLYLSFCKFTTINKAAWVGIGNYVKVFEDAQFWTSLGFTASFTVVSTILINVLAFAVALALTKGIKGTNVFRTVYFMPNLIGGIVLGYIWNILINCVLSIAGQPLLALNNKAGYWGMIILMRWQQIGYMMIIYIAGIQSIPKELTDAAIVDGANVLQTMFFVNIPCLKPTIWFCTLNSVIAAVSVFDVVYVLTGGGPNNATNVLNYYSYYKAFKEFKFGYGAAVGAVQAVVVLLISLVIFAYGRKGGMNNDS